MASIASKVSLTLDLPPSCVQFCPAHPEYLIIGTYNLQRDESDNAEVSSGGEKKSQSRNGSLVVYKTDGATL